MKKYFVFIILLAVLHAPYVHAAVPATTGIIPGQIWYSKDPLVEGDTALIYTAVWNGDTNPLQAKVEFYDKNVILGSRDITVPSNGLQDVSVSWKVTSGDHTISAKIISSSITNGSKKEIVTLERNITESDQTFVPVKVTAPLPTDVVKTDVSKVVSKVADSIPPEVTSSVSAFDTMRGTVAQTVAKSLTDTKAKLAQLTKQTLPIKKGTLASTVQTSKPTDSTEKPIAYVKIFFLSIVSFIFGHKIVFYGLIAFILFLVFRFLYRKIRNR